MNVTVFSSSGCAVCHSEMRWLDQKGVKYNNEVIDETDEAMANMMEATGGIIQGTPFTVVENDGKKETIAGFDRAKLSGMLGLA